MLAITAAVSLLAPAGCSRRFYRDQADKQVEEVLTEKDRDPSLQTASSAGTYIVTVFDKLGELAPSPIQPLAGNTAIPSTTPVRRSLRQDAQQGIERYGKNREIELFFAACE